MPLNEAVIQAALRNRAVLEIARTMVACERFRLANGRWPDSLDELLPRFLDAVPTDPFLGEPVRLKRFGGGLIIHTAGADGLDHGGTFEPRWRPIPGFDIGHRLFDPERRPMPADARREESR